MQKIITAVVLLSLGLFAIGCGGGGYEYQPPPANADVDEQVEKDAGVVTDDELMSQGAGTTN